jgi:acetate kinase
MYQYRVRKYVGAYAAAMGGVDVIVFTGGIGENDSVTRAEAMTGLEYMGVEMNFEKNDGLRGKEEVISTENARVKVMIVPTDEEKMIALDTFKIVDEKLIS